MAAITLIDLSRKLGSLGALKATDNIVAEPKSSRNIKLSLISLPRPGDEGCGASEKPSQSESLNATVEQDYMIVTSTSNGSLEIYEIQSIQPNSGKYSSFFVGSRVISNPDLHLSTRVDPLYFALSHFHRAIALAGVTDESPREKENGESNNQAKAQLLKWQPWDQALSDMPKPILQALDLDPSLNLKSVNDVRQLGHLLEVTDMYGDDMILCKFSEKRALNWLVAKFNQTLTATRARLLDRKQRMLARSVDPTLMGISGGSGAFCSSFNLGDEEKKEESESELQSKDNTKMNVSLTKEEENSARAGALQLICDYVPTQWRHKLISELGMSNEDLTGKKKVPQLATAVSPTNSDAIEVASSPASGQKRPRSSWEGTIGQEDADSLLNYTFGRSGSGGAQAVTPNEKNEVKNAKSVGLKKLAKVNTKGMKSLASFFGAGKKKK